MTHEIGLILRSIWFPIYVLGVPVIGAILFVFASPLDSQAPGQAAVELSSMEKVGYVDNSGIISIIPPDRSSTMLISYQCESEAKAALEAKKISSFYIVPSDYIESGELVCICTEFKILSRNMRTCPMDGVLQFNLAEWDNDLVSSIQKPMDLEVKAIAKKARPDEKRNQFRRVYSNSAIRYIPEYTMFVFYMIICISGGLMLKLMSKDKTNRVMEIVLTSVSHKSLFYGKILAHGTLGFAQGLLWITTGYLLVYWSGWTKNIEHLIDFPPTIIIWWIVFFILGYAVYASLMAGLGALVQDIKASPMVQFVFIAPLVCPLLPFEALGENYVIGLSFFPLTSSMMMVQRIAGGAVPLWQIFVSASLLLVTALFIVRTAAAMFRAQNLLSGEPFSLKRYTLELLGVRRVDPI